MPNVIETATRFRNQLGSLETSATNDLIDAYQRIVNRLEDKITVLMSRIEVLEAQGNLTPEAVRKQAVWSSLLNQIEDEIKRYGGFVDTQNQLSANKALDLAGKHSGLLTRTYFENNPALLQAFNTTWDRLPNESVEKLLGFLQADSQLSINLNQALGFNAAQNFQNKLLEGIALGYNPKKINSLINQTLSEPLTWSMNTISTTTQYAYRESARANYVNNSEIVGGWKWYAALDGRVCLSCVSKHGQSFTNEQRLNDHHRGRCTQIPVIKDFEKFGLENIQVELGENWFNNLPTTQKIERMGQAKYNAYLAGEFKFNELSEAYQNDTFGEMLKEASLRSIIGQERANRYYSY